MQHRIKVEIREMTPEGVWAGSPMEFMATGDMEVLAMVAGAFVDAVRDFVLPAQDILVKSMDKDGYAPAPTLRDPEGD